MRPRSQQSFVLGVVLLLAACSESARTESGQSGGSAATQGGSTVGSSAESTRSTNARGGNATSSKSAAKGGEVAAASGGRSSSEDTRSNASGGNDEAEGGSDGQGGILGSTRSSTSSAGGNSGINGNATGGKTGAGGNATGGKTGAGGNATGGKTGGGGNPAGGNATGGNAAGGKTELPSSTSPAETNHVFLLLGQSNMAGYPKAQESDKQKNDQIQVLGFDDCSATSRKSDQWAAAAPPLHECFQGAIGPGDWFAKTIIAKYPAGHTIWLVPCALSGQAISVMSKGGSKWDWLVARAKKGQQKGPIEGMLFHQGESDCGNSGWPAKVKQMYTDLKGALGLTKDVPFLAGELPPASKCTNHNPLVNQLPSVIGSNAYVISAQGLNLDPVDTQWYMHIDHDSQVTFGKRYAETMIKALGL
ncbi:MAG: sialate O-acetylesterase [Myxococcales bacterium]